MTNEGSQPESTNLFDESVIDMAGNFMKDALKIESSAVKRTKSGEDFADILRSAWENLGREYFLRFFPDTPGTSISESEHNLYMKTVSQKIQNKRVEGHNVLERSTSANIKKSIVSGHNALSEARNPKITQSLIVGHNALSGAVSPSLESSVVIGYNALSSAESATLKNSLVLGASTLSGTIRGEEEYRKLQYIPQEDLPEDSGNLDPDLFSSIITPHLRKEKPRYTSVNIQGCVIYGKYALEQAEGIVKNSLVFSLGGKVSNKIKFVNSVVVTPTNIVQFLGEGQDPIVTINKTTWLMAHPKMTSLRDKPHPN